jgi:ribonuclease III
LSSLEKSLGYRFADASLLQRALTHRSFGADHNERLEFLGDAVLNAAVGHLLYSSLKASAEGDLSRARANLVRQDTLYRIALDLGLPTLLRLGEGEQKSGGSQRPSILADALEAVIGAVYLDAEEHGFNTAASMVRRLFSDVEFTASMPALGKDAKTALQEYLQARKMPVPIYRVVRTTGAAHKQVFEVACDVTAFRLSEQAHGASRRAAEQLAAEAMLKRIESHPSARASAANPARVVASV